MSAPIRVLHIDDEPEFADLTAIHLQEEDERLEVETALTTVGLERLDSLAYDCVVSDYDMPHTNGLELLTAIREEHPDLPFILFTGKGSEEIASEAVSLGVTDYLEKGGPEAYTVLANRIVNAVEGHRADQRSDRYESLLERGPDPICVIRPRGDVTYASPPIAEVLGHEPHELEGNDGFALFHPEDRETVIDTHESVAAAAPGATGRIEARMQRADGSWVWVEGQCRNLSDGAGVRGVPIYLREIPEPRAEADLAATEERYARILAHSSDYVMIVDGSGQVSYVSPAVERVMGYDPDELLGVNAFEFVHPEDYELAAGAFSEVFTDTEEEITVEYRAKCADDSWMWIEARGSNRLDDPAIEGILVNVRDIDGKKGQEQALREEQAFIEQSLNALQDIFYVIDPEGRLLRWNDRVPELTGYSDEELAEIDVLEFIPEEKHGRITASIQRVLTEGGDTIEVELEGKDGRRLPIEFTGVRLTDPDDQLIGIAGIGRDIGERRAREEQLERNETILEALRDPVYALDADGHFTYVNDALARVTGYERSELLGEPASKVLPAETARRGANLIEEFLEEGTRERRTWEIEVLTADGERIPHETHMALLPFDEEGKFRGTAGVVRDMSDRLERERELERQNERLEEFASIVSHDLRNPLHVAIGRLALAREECDSQHLDEIAQAHENMETLIADLLAVTRQGETVGETEPVRLSRFVEDCWGNIEFGDATLRIETDLVLLADRTPLRQLLENLMRNAVEHAGPEVTVVVGDLPDGQGFFVEDDGPGIPPEHRDRVFERGYSLQENGSGLGLSIVERVAEDHGWSLRLTNGADSGARFEFSAVERPK